MSTRQEKRKDVTGRFCACGQAAAAYVGNDYVCARCQEIEDAMRRANPTNQNPYIERRRRPEWRSVIEPYRVHLQGFA